MPSQHSSQFMSFAFDSGNGHGIVGGGLVSHPSDDGGFGPLLNRDALCSSDCAASNWRSMIGDGLSHLLRQICVIGMEVEEGHARLGITTPQFNRRRVDLHG
jgi:hypothetical protein